jgi:hypothetical protein
MVRPHSSGHAVRKVPNLRATGGARNRCASRTVAKLDYGNELGVGPTGSACRMLESGVMYISDTGVHRAHGQTIGVVPEDSCSGGIQQAL